MYREYVERRLSVIFNGVEEAEWENSYYKFVKSNKQIRGGARS